MQLVRVTCEAEPSVTLIYKWHHTDAQWINQYGHPKMGWPFFNLRDGNLLSFLKGRYSVDISLTTTISSLFYQKLKFHQSKN